MRRPLAATLRVLVGLGLGLGSTDAIAGDFGAARSIQITHTWPIVQATPSLFGDAIALSSSFAAIGAPLGEGIDGVNVGSVFIYQSQQNTLTSHSTLFGTTPDGAFGSVVAIAPPLLAVRSASPEEVHLYRLTAGIWEPEQTLVKPALMGFGAAMVVDDATGSLVVGATHPPAAGRVFIYRPSEGLWAHDPPLVSPVVGAHFGASLAVHDDTLAIGAPLELDVGAVHLASREDMGFALTGVTLDPGNNPDILEFGAALSLSDDDLLAIGAPGSDAEQGVVFVYRLSALDLWELQAILRSPEGLASRFGTSLAFVEGSLLVGAPAAENGLVYVYNSPENALAPPSLTMSDLFQPPGARYGEKLASSNRRALIGAPAPMTAEDGDAVAVDLLYALGNACDATTICASGQCVDNLCCDTPCDAPCMRCSVAAGGDADGTCTPLVCDVGEICIAADDACATPPETTTTSTGETSTGDTQATSTGDTLATGPGLGLEPSAGGCSCDAWSERRATPTMLLTLLALLGLRGRRARSASRATTRRP